MKLNKNTFQNVTNLLLSDNAEKRLEGMDLAFETYEKTLLADNEFDIKMDLFYNNVYRPRAQEAATTIINTYFNNPDFMKKLHLTDPFNRKLLEALAKHNTPKGKDVNIEEYIDLFAREGIKTLVGLPDSLYTNIYRALGRVQASSLDDAFKKLPLELFPSVESQIDEWVKINIQEAVDTFNTRFSLVKEQTPGKTPDQFVVAKPQWLIIPTPDGKVDLAASQEIFARACEALLGSSAMDIPTFIADVQRDHNVQGKEHRYAILNHPDIPSLPGLLYEKDGSFTPIQQAQSAQLLDLSTQEEKEENNERGLLPEWSLLAINSKALSA
jgi:hypothetical protein